MSPIVLVAGASRGFGLSLGRNLSAKGATVVFGIRDVAGRNSAIVGQLHSEGLPSVEVDVTNAASCNDAVGEVCDRFGGLDVLVYNAAVGAEGPVESATASDLQKVFDTNLVGLLRLVKATLPRLRERQQATILHISSGAGRFTVPGRGIYASSKWAAEALIETLQLEVASWGIRCAIAELGPMRTEFSTNSLVLGDVTSAEYPEFGGALASAYSSADDVAEQLAQQLLDFAHRPLVTARTTRFVHHPLKDLLDEYNQMLKRLVDAALELREFDPDDCSAGLNDLTP